MPEQKGYQGLRPTSVSAKRCPACAKIVGLQAAECTECGHLFRTQFHEPSDRTEAFDAVLLARPPRPPVRPVPAPVRADRHSAAATFGMAFLGSFSLIALLGLGAWLALGAGPQAGPLGAHPPKTRPALAGHIAGARTGDAADLYGRIALSMSLYDLDQAAGGLGRVIHSADPHTLLLSYDYPTQTVRVSLFRSDPAGDDYQVQAVALYRGTRLLHRTVGE